MKRFVGLGLALAVGLTFGCRGDDSNDNADAGNNTGSDGGGGAEVTIQEVQAPTMAVGTAVTLRGVVVVAIDAFGDRVGSVYVMEPAGGPNSGMLVFADVTQASNVSVGDLIDVTNAVKDEFSLEMDTCTRTSDCTLTELEAAPNTTLTLTKVGDGTVPEPQLLNAWDLAADDAEAEKWESVLIRFEKVSVNTAPFPVSMSDLSLKEMRISGPFLANSDLTDLGSPSADDCLASITGLGNYFFNYKILPRNSGDIVTGGTGCPVQEEGDVACMNNSDDDYDGFKDCEDRSCQASVTNMACHTDTSVVDVQNGTTPENTLVVIRDAIVTAISSDKKHLWVADAVTGAAYNGVYAYRGPSPDDLAANITVGSTVDVVGTTSEFDFNNSCSGSNTQIDDAIVTFKSGGATTTPLTGLDVATLIAAGGAQYEGTLVTLANVLVVDTPDNNGTWSVGVAGTKLYAEDDLLTYAATASECVTITGVMHYNGFSDCRPVILPREVVAGTCN